VAAGGGVCCASHHSLLVPNTMADAVTVTSIDVVKLESVVVTILHFSASVAMIVNVTLGEVDMDVAATLASLGSTRSSAVLTDRERKLLKIRYEIYL